MGGRCASSRRRAETNHAQGEHQANADQETGRAGQPYKTSMADILCLKLSSVWTTLPRPTP